MFYPILEGRAQTRSVLSRFLGYDRRESAPEGSFAFTENLSALRYPNLSPRAPRGLVGTLTAPQGLGARERLAWVDGSTLYWNGQAVTGPVLSTLPGLCPKTLVSMGAYLIVFPDGVYLNTADLSDWGSLNNQRVVNCEMNGLQVSLCQEDGSPLEGYTLSEKMPSEPEDGDLWLDTGSAHHALKIYSEATGLWASVAVTWVRLEAPGIGLGFRQYDGVTVSGVSAEGDLAAQAQALCGTHVITAREDNALVLPGLLDQCFTQTTGTVTVSRQAPAMDFVTECGNRLWGCRYGLKDGKPVNEIYACALGDFKNWQKFQGLATDSYTASRGVGGPWTGAITYLDCPLFFKEDCIEKVYPAPTGAHQIVTTHCAGVQRGSGRSLAIADGVLYYQSPTGVCAYDGSLPQPVSQALGRERYNAAVGGSLGSLYYLSLKDARNARHLFVLDTARGLWHREDGLDAAWFGTVGSELYCLTETGKLWAMTGGAGTPEGPVSWEAQTTPMGLLTPESKYVARLCLTLQLTGSADVWISYDSDGQWQHLGHFSADGVPHRRRLTFVPRRRGHFALRLQGEGPCQVMSLTKYLSEGSDVL